MQFTYGESKRLYPISGLAIADFQLHKAQYEQTAINFPRAEWAELMIEGPDWRYTTPNDRPQQFPRIYRLLEEIELWIFPAK